LFNHLEPMICGCSILLPCDRFDFHERSVARQERLR
jgi:hypothetical protein